MTRHLLLGLSAAAILTACQGKPVKVSPVETGAPAITTEVETAPAYDRGILSCGYDQG